MKLDLTVKDIAANVLRHFIKTAEGSSVKDIAERLIVSETAVRSRINAESAVVPGCVPTKEWRTGTSKAAVYYPTRECLRDHILALKSELKETRKK